MDLPPTTHQPGENHLSELTTLADIAEPVNGINKERMMLLALQGKGATAIGEELGCSKSYVSQVLKPKMDEIKAYLAFKDNPQALWEYQEYRTLNAINEEKLKKMNGRDLFTAAGISRDKVNIFTGKAPVEAENMVFNVVYNDNRVMDGSKDDKPAPIDITPTVDNT